MTDKNLAYYMNLGYTTVLRKDEEGDVVAHVEELPGCKAHGESETEALARLKEVKELWLSDCLEVGDSIPEPSTEESLPSGKWVQRVPRTLHRSLTKMAVRENVSLNQLVTSILAEAIGRTSAAARPDPIETALSELKSFVEGSLLCAGSAHGWFEPHRTHVRLGSPSRTTWYVSNGPEQSPGRTSDGFIFLEHLKALTPNRFKEKLLLGEHASEESTTYRSRR